MPETAMRQIGQPCLGLMRGDQVNRYSRPPSSLGTTIAKGASHASKAFPTRQRRVWINSGAGRDNMAGDAAKARRFLMSAKSNAESQRWEYLDENMKKAATEMEGLPDAQKAPL